MDEKRPAADSRESTFIPHGLQLSARDKRQAPSCFIFQQNTTSLVLMYNASAANLDPGLGLTNILHPRRIHPKILLPVDARFSPAGTPFSRCHLGIRKQPSTLIRIDIHRRMPRVRVRREGNPGAGVLRSPDIPGVEVGPSFLAGAPRSPGGRRKPPEADLGADSRRTSAAGHTGRAAGPHCILMSTLHHNSCRLHRQREVVVTPSGGSGLPSSRLRWLPCILLRLHVRRPWRQGLALRLVSIAIQWAFRVPRLPSGSQRHRRRCRRHASGPLNSAPTVHGFFRS